MGKVGTLISSCDLARWFTVPSQYNFTTWDGLVHVHRFSVEAGAFHVHAVNQDAIFGHKIRLDLMLVERHDGGGDRQRVDGNGVVP